MSFAGYSFSLALEDAIKDAHDAGVLVVASAGNDGIDCDQMPSYPACYDIPNVIAVAATDNQDQLADWGGGRSSNYGASTIHIAAPGRHTFTVEDGGGYAYFGGTSAAAPIVAGVAALVWSVYPNWTVAQVRARLLDSVRTENEEGQLSLPVVTGGVIDAGAAVQ